jgi:hypothetical protein
MFRARRTQTHTHADLFRANIFHAAAGGVCNTLSHAVPPTSKISFSRARSNVCAGIKSGMFACLLHVLAAQMIAES